MDPSTLDVGICRLLEGNRFRVASESWVAVRAQLVGTSVWLEFETPRPRRIVVELPDGFDLHEPEHVAWLFHNVERELAT